MNKEICRIQNDYFIFEYDPNKFENSIQIG